VAKPKLDERKAANQRAVVSEIKSTAQPVGSSHVADVPEVRVSPATVRNEMAVLEQEGYLVQPHTSAGRIPTDKGYRYFVDTLVGPGPLEPAQSQRVREFFTHAHRELEAMLQDTSRLLSDLTAYAAVVVGPPHEVATIRSVQLVSLAPRAALLVAVLSNGAVERRALEFTEDVGEERVAAATAHLGAHLTGRSVGQLVDPPATGDPETDRLVASAVTALGVSVDDEAEHVYVGGASHIASAFDAVDTVRNVLETLEKHYVVVTLLRDVIDNGLSVAIGTEHGLQPLADCSIVVSPYEVGGEQAGSIAVLDPTRMNYPQAIAAVAVVSQRLGTRLSEG
jgi:heat-inducible transcriptional repressor